MAETQRGFNLPTSEVPNIEDEVSPKTENTGSRGFNLPTSTSDSSASASRIVDSDKEFGLLKKPATFGRVSSDEPTGLIGKGIDLLSRGQFASTAFVDSLLNGEGGPAALGGAFATAISELVSPEQRMSYKDILHKTAPVWAATNPNDATLLGFVGDVMLDPTTYLTFGVSTATRFVAKGGTLALKEVGEAALKKVIKEVGEEVLEKGGREVTEDIVEDSVKGSIPAIQKEVPLSRKGVSEFKRIHEAEKATGLTGEALRESADAMFSKLILDENLSKDLIDKGGVKFAGRTIGGKAQIKALDFLNRALRIDKVKSVLSGLPGAKTLNRTFNRNAELPDEYVNSRRHLEAELNRVEESVAKETFELFRPLTKVQRDKLGKVSAEIDDATRAAFDASDTPLTPEQTRRIADERILENDLSAEEFNVYSQTRRRYQEVGELEQQAGMLDHLIENYTPRRYEAIREASMG